MEDTSQVGEILAAYLIHVPQEKLEEFTSAVGPTGVNFHPVESQVHIDCNSDLNAPNMKSGEDLARHVRHINRFLEQEGWSPLMTQPDENTDPVTAAEILETANLWFEWSGITVTGFHRGDTQEEWPEFTGHRPRVFGQAGQEADKEP